MSRATRNHTVIDQRAVRRTALAQIETLTRDKCTELLQINQQNGFILYDGSVAGLQREVLSAFNSGILNARDIERAWQGDRRAQ